MTATALTYPPDLRRVGLGYELIHMQHGVRLRVDALRESRGDVKGELLVVARDELVERGIRETLTSGRSRKTVADRLKGAAPGIPWDEYVPALFTFAIDGMRSGTPPLFLEDAPPRETPLYALAPVLQHGKATVIFGPGGTGKSMLAKAIALAVASGRQVVPGWQPTQAPVLVLDWETDIDDWKEDVQALAAGAGISMPSRTITYRRMVGTLEAAVQPLAALVQERGIGLLVVDSVEPAAGRNREGGDPSDTAHRLHDALALLGCTSLLIDHVKGESTEKDAAYRRPYGSVYKENRARSTFSLRRDELGTLALVHEKVNRGPKLPPAGLRFVFEQGRIYVETADIAQSDTLARAALSQPEQVLRLLADGPLTAPQVAAAMGKERDQIATVLARLLQHGKVDKEPGTRPRWFVKDGGTNEG